MKTRIGSIVLLTAMFVLATSIAGFASAPCGLPSLIVCQGWDGTGNLYASQNDVGGFGNFATVYDNFTLNQKFDIYSFHWVGGYFGGGTSGNITAWTLTFYNDNNGTPGGAITSGTFSGNANETSLGGNIYSNDLYFCGYPIGPGTYWASVVPDQVFPPQWGWATSAQGDGNAYQVFFGSGSPLATDFAFGIDTPEPGTLVMLGTGILGLAGTLRRKLL